MRLLIKQLVILQVRYFVRLQEKTGQTSVISPCLHAVQREVYTLELVADLTAECFIRCFRRFSARRGLPTRIVSDNAKTFKTADRKLAALFDLPDVQNYLLNQRIKWRYNLPKASWWGGLFERLVGMTKRCLKKIIGKARLSYDELFTAVTEVEGILNSRPLTYVQSDDIE